MKKTNIIIIYGAIAVGKLTVARLLAEKIGYKLSHNHLLNDLVYSTFEKNTPLGKGVLEKFRYLFYEEVVKAGINTIITHAYSHTYVSPTGQSDTTYIQNLENLFEKLGAHVTFIHLKASNDVLLKRATQDSRKEFGKLTDTEIMKDVLERNDFATSAPVKNDIIIDTSLLTADETVAHIIEKLQ